MYFLVVDHRWGWFRLVSRKDSERQQITVRSMDVAMGICGAVWAGFSCESCRLWRLRGTIITPLVACLVQSF